ncbi:carboxylesterase/lipase family protein [Allokutzneria albata]|uniref:Para-nitrobenzyl esterase n=1 Tax=Allokutzneria albata TaxID=211114 RepID=A0A1G9SJ20_ALLAB|nr:carboxylesterase family protein [Allokutzneria albata]SDM35297.1 para-nitrobenzyl esterase [Allokutzneria albata]
MRKSLSVLSVGALLATGCATSVRIDDAGELVRTANGALRGTVTAEHRLFQGIPYAAPPVGPLRWASPRPAEKWQEVRDATKPGSPCPQEATEYADSTSSVEDCLFLNVTAPRSATRRTPKPTMVWIHGDGVVGAGSHFDARSLATAGDVVVVTVNYRLGIFGGFAHPGLADSGSFGLQDQQAALRWVRENIRDFGGDAGNVTLFGESYGAQSTTAHLTSPSAKGLFDKAIVQSGFGLMDLPAGAMMTGVPAVEWFGWRALQDAETESVRLARELGCADSARVLDCLRSLPVSALVPHMRSFQPFAFGSSVLPELPAKVLREGRAQRIPVITGTTRDEHSLLVGLFHDMLGSPVTEQEYPRLLAEAFGAKAEEVLAKYPLADYASPSLAWSAVLTDRMWARSNFEQAQLFARSARTFFYTFADRNAPMYLPLPQGFTAGAYHAADVPYLFPDAEFHRASTPGQRALSSAMMRYWANFARAADPNGSGLPKWAPFGPGEYVQSLAPGANGITRADYPAQHKLGFWNGLN